ncbi:MAG: prolyl oligopeptidase family serine peptidase [Chloroflexi bacterium]|nr:prolyl oligopeptidase family serine peptidase [Chloroflexota bacterium]
MSNKNNAQPRLPDIARSMIPYLFSGASKVDGTVSTQETNSGQKFAIYTPPGYASSSDDFSIIYHLHGAGMFWTWVYKELHWIATQHEASVAMGKTVPMVIVSLFDPSKFSMWADSADGSNDISSAIRDDLIPHVEQHYKIKGTRNTRFIQGFSMGGFGAATHAFKYQDLFAAAVIWDGAMHNWETITATRPKIAANQFGNSEAEFSKWSPWIAAEQADISQTPVMIISGLMVDFADRYTEHLQKLGAQVTRYSEDCKHEMKCLESKRGQAVFEFFNEMIS